MRQAFIVGAILILSGIAIFLIIQIRPVSGDVLPVATTGSISPISLTPNIPQPTGTPTLTPYVAIFNGFFNCREQPSTASPALVLIQGQQVTIMAQNQGWLYVSVQYFDKPCWVSMADIPNLDGADVTLVPTYSNSVTPTFTLPVSSTPESRPTSNQPIPTATLMPFNTPVPISPTPVPPQPPTKPPRCSDGLDNDNDGYIDFPADPQCSSANDTSEGGGGDDDD